MRHPLFLAVGFAALVLSGCNSTAPKEAEAPKSEAPTGTTTTGGTGNMAMAATPAKGIVKNGLYVSKTTGVPLCPVSGDEIAKGKEVGKATYKGVEYHFCCSGCPEEFKSHPAAYAVK